MERIALPTLSKIGSLVAQPTLSLLDVRRVPSRAALAFGPYRIAGSHRSAFLWPIERVRVRWPLTNILNKRPKVGLPCLAKRGAVSTNLSPILVERMARAVAPILRSRLIEMTVTLHATIVHVA
jgi:hypothetical protein